MIQMEYPKLPLDGLTPEEQIKALKRQVDILTDNLQIVLNSIEDDVGNVDNTSDKDKPISDAVQEALDEISEALDTKVDKVTGKGLSTNDYTTSAKNKVDGTEAYVVESGTSGEWKYRKWSDGTAEAWGYHNFGSVAITNAWGNGFYATAKSYNLPSGLFTSIDATMFGTYVNNGLGGWRTSGVTTSAISGYWHDVKSETVTAGLNTYVIGKWK